MTSPVAAPTGVGRAATAPSIEAFTQVELVWIEKQIEHWIRFGREQREQILDRRRRILFFPPGSILALVRWAANEHGTVLSRLDIMRTVKRDAACQTVPTVTPGAEVLLHVDGWPKVERVLQLIDAIEARGIDPIEVSPDHWRHVHNRMTVGETPRLWRSAASRLSPAPGDRRMTRLSYAIVMTVAVSLLGVASIASFAPKLIWNASASTPVGFYTIDEPGPVAVTDLVAVDAPEPLATFLSDGGYLPRGVPLLKRIAALPGQRVCRTGLAITVDGVPIGDALDRDRRGRPLPVWQGCRRVAAGELFLMNWQVRDSLDGRYFGPLPASAVIGRATPLYTDEDGDGRFVWRAPTR